MSNPPTLAIRPAQLRAKALPLDTFRENVVVLSRRSEVVRPERLSGTRRLELRLGGRDFVARPIIADDDSVVAPGEIGLPQPMMRRLGAKPGEWISVAPARRPDSLRHLTSKLTGGTFSEEGLREMVRDLAAYRWTDIDVAAFLVACAGFMTAEETLALTRAMIDCGDRLVWPRAPVVDKHCIGGVPGNRTSLIVTPIVAAHGLTMPKTSSRAITSSAGSADTMEVLARVDLTAEEMHSVVDRCGACIVWGGRVNLSRADDVLISVERPLGIDTAEQMVASILSKKAAAGSTHLVLDLPVGPTAKLRDPNAAQKLRKLFEFVADKIGLTVDVVVTEARQPIGRGIGPAMEARDVRAVLEGSTAAPDDLRKKALFLAGRVLEMDPRLRGGAGQARARELLESGAAARKMDEICEAQGASPITPASCASVFEVAADQAGIVTDIDCLSIARIARAAGAPTDPAAGIDLLRRVGDRVGVGEPLYRIHAQDPFDFQFACEAAGEVSGFRIFP